MGLGKGDRTSSLDGGVRSTDAQQVLQELASGEERPGVIRCRRPMENAKVTVWCRNRKHKGMAYEAGSHPGADHSRPGQSCQENDLVMR